jgi:hypothetical protein
VKSLTQDQLDRAAFAEPAGKHGSLFQKFIGKVTIDGQDYFWKGAGRENAEKNALVADLLAGLGVATPGVRAARVPAAPSADGSGVGDLVDWVGGTTYWQAVRDNGGRSDGLLARGEVQRAALAGCLLGIGDRTGNNFMVDGGRLVSIDHDVSLWSQAHPAGIAETLRYALAGNQPLLDEAKGSDVKDFDDYRLDPAALTATVRGAVGAEARLRAAGDDRSAEVVARVAGVMRELVESGDTGIGAFDRLCREAFTAPAAPADEGDDLFGLD